MEELGSDAFAYGRLQTEAAPGDAERPLVLRADARKPPAKGEIVHVAIRPGEVHVFSPQTGLRISDARQLRRVVAAGRPRPAAPRVLG